MTKSKAFDWDMAMDALADEKTILWVALNTLVNAAKEGEDLEELLDEAADILADTKPIPKTKKGK